MAESIVVDLVDFKLRREPAGVRVTVCATEAFELSLKARARGNLADRIINGEYCDVWDIREATCSDADLSPLLFLKGSSLPGGVTVVLPLVRSREQMTKAAEQVTLWIEAHFSAYMRAIEVTATVKARSFAGLPPENVPAVAPAPASSLRAGFTSDETVAASPRHS